MMKLPNSEKAYIPPIKLTAFFLSETHAVGRSKARLFRSLDFNENNVSLLRDSIRIRTIWIIEKGQERPRFVTAYPV